MTQRRQTDTARKGHQFGGAWTTAKLELIAKYLSSYTTALNGKPSKQHPFKKGYIDAFAGTGYRDGQRGEANVKSPQAVLLPDLAGQEPQEFLDGSARLALKTVPPFDSYVFIERSALRSAELETLKSEFPDLANRIQVRRGDANAEIRTLCEKDWSSHRAVLFLDPYGMQVEWTTIEAIAATKAIDLWILFPLGIGVNRLLTKSGDIPESWRKRLELLLGTGRWYEDFYRVERESTLFGEADRVVKATTETIGRYFNQRLGAIFAGVADHPKVLRNSVNCPLYLLCFAVGNQNGAPVALRIANNLLKEAMR